MSGVTLEQMSSQIMQMLEEYDLTYTWARRPTEAWASIDLEEVCISQRWAEKNALAWTPRMARKGRESLSWYAARLESGSITLSGLKPPKAKRKSK